jgi:uncharacterized membrane protein
MIGLGDLPGGRFYSQATGISADASVIIGNGNMDTEAFVWTAYDGMLDVKKILVDSGNDMSAWSTLHAWGISDDGRTVVGIGHHANGIREAWMAQLDIAEVLAPSPLVAFIGIGLTVGLMEWRKSRRRRARAKA